MGHLSTTHRFRSVIGVAAVVIALSLGTLTGCQHPVIPQPEEPVSGGGAIGSGFEGGRYGSSNDDSQNPSPDTADQNGPASTTSPTQSDDMERTIFPPDMSHAAAIDASRARNMLQHAAAQPYSSVTFDFAAATESSSSFRPVSDLRMYGQLDTSGSAPAIHTSYSFGMGSMDIDGLEIYLHGNEAVVVLTGIPIGVALEGTEYEVAIDAVTALVSESQVDAVLNAAESFLLDEGDGLQTVYLTVDPTKLATTSILDINSLAGAATPKTMIVAYELNADQRIGSIIVYYESSDSLGSIVCFYDRYNQTSVPAAPKPLISLDAADLFTADLSALASQAK